MQFVLYCLDHPGQEPLRKATRDAHLAHLAANQVSVQLAGPLLGEDGSMLGSLLVVEAVSRAQVEAFAQADPYQQAGLFRSVEIRQFRQVLPALGA